MTASKHGRYDPVKASRWKADRRAREAYDRQMFAFVAEQSALARRFGIPSAPVEHPPSAIEIASWES